MNLFQNYYPSSLIPTEHRVVSSELYTSGTFSTRTQVTSVDHVEHVNTPAYSKLTHCGYPLSHCYSQDLSGFVDPRSILSNSSTAMILTTTYYTLL